MREHRQHHPRQAEFPNQSDRDRCELRIDNQDRLYCEQQNCDGDCVLYSLPWNNPKGKRRVEKQPCEPKEGRYYFCKCEPRVQT